jgi:hypothetical protein
MHQLFLLQIVKADRPDHPVVQIPGGGALERDLVATLTTQITLQALPLFAPEGLLEAEFVSEVTDAIVAKGVGVFKTESQVKAAIRSGVRETLQRREAGLALPNRLAAAIERGVSAALANIKLDTKAVVGR